VGDTGNGNCLGLNCGAVNSETEFTLIRLVATALNCLWIVIFHILFAWHWHIWATDNNFGGLMMQITLISVLPCWVFSLVELLTNSPTDQMVLSLCYVTLCGATFKDSAVNGTEHCYSLT
jgi:hypothetical protein